MKKTGVVITAALFAAVLIFSSTVFADEPATVDPNEKTEETQQTPVTKPIRKTGLYKENGKYRYYKNGVFQKVTGAVQDLDGKFRYVKNGIFSQKTGIVKRITDGKWVYVKKGLFQKSTGVAKRLKDGKQLYVKNGVFKKITGIAKRLNSKQYVYVKKGIFSPKTGLVQKQNKQWVLVKKGILVTNPKKFFLTAADRKAGRSELMCEVYARAVYQKAVKPKMTKAQKLRACFDYLTPTVHYQYLMYRVPYYNGPDSAIVYTLDMMQDGGSTCHGFGALFAYLGKLCGYKNSYYCWSSYHGWAEIDGLIYDPVFLGSPHFTEVYATSYGVGRGMGLGTDYVEMNRYRIPKFTDK